jgi:hypothetical protein
VEDESGRTRRLGDVYDLECDIRQRGRERVYGGVCLKSEAGSEERDAGCRKMEDVAFNQQAPTWEGTIVRTHEMTRHPVSASALAGKLPSLGLCAACCHPRPSQRLINRYDPSCAICADRRRIYARLTPERRKKSVEAVEDSWRAVRHPSHHSVLLDFWLFHRISPFEFPKFIQGVRPPCHSTALLHRWRLCCLETARGLPCLVLCAFPGNCLPSPY